MATPQKRRPMRRTVKLFQCFVKQPRVYTITYVNAAFFRPLYQPEGQSRVTISTGKVKKALSWKIQRALNKL